MGLTIIDNNNIFQKDVIGNVRIAQEDSHDIAALTPNGDVFVVCDGMGGHVGGKQASSIAVKSIIDYLKKERYPQPTQALNDALQFANMQILGYANEHPELKGMGTTACIVLLQDSEAYIAHVGDSRIYLYLGQEKQLHRITKDHSYVQTLVDAGQISDEEAEHHPNKNRILKALGIRLDLVPSFGKVQPKNGDVFLICSDGLSGMVSDSTMREVLMQNKSIEYKGNTLINLALDAGGLDNITLELIHIVSSPHSKSVFRRYNPNPTGTNPPPNPRRRYIFGITTIAIVILLLCSLLIFQHKRKVIEEQIATTNAKITEIDSLIILTKDGINKYKKDIEALLIERDAKASKIDDPSQRNEVIKKYDEQCRIIRTDSIDAEEKKKEYERQREELIKTYKKDSIRIEQE
ncbi:MAG: Stp1/IreP family PP2C-type Ser/Thr phosphatase [Bacteroidaceae bacterium]|nr:Stp1/IreP family PP2C-type Ser/Thr phosphatase [Bacteroidaceae bacterium]